MFFHFGKANGQPLTLFVESAFLEICLFRSAICTVWVQLLPERLQAEIVFHSIFCFAFSNQPASLGNCMKRNHYELVTN